MNSYSRTIFVIQTILALIFPHEYILRYVFCILNSDLYEMDEDEEDGAQGKNPVAAAKEMKEALATGGVDAVADMGAKSAAKLGGMMAKGVGGIAGKAFGSFF